MEAGAEGEQVNTAEQEADSNQHPNHPEQPPGLHGHDQHAEDQGDDAVKQAPTPATHPCVTEGHKHRNHAFEDENDADGKGQTGHHQAALERTAAELLNHPGPHHDEEGGNHQPRKAIPASQLAGAGQVAYPTHDAAHQKAHRHDHGDPGGSQHREDQGQHPKYQHQHPLKQGEGLQSLAFGRKQT